MPDLTRSQLAALSRVLREGRNLVSANALWSMLHCQYGIGQLTGTKIVLSATDRKTVLDLVQKWTGLNVLTDSLVGSRTDLAGRGAVNEKLGMERPLASRVVCTALGAPLHFDGKPMEVFPEVEYRLDYRRLTLTHYSAILVIENHEAFLAADKINWSHESVLVLYRGHDDSVTAVSRCLADAPRGMKIIYFTDPDPAGIGIIRDAIAATHALVPSDEFFALGTHPNNMNRFADQYRVRPGLQDVVLTDASVSSAFREYARRIFSGHAFSQEFLIARGVPLECVPVGRG